MVLLIPLSAYKKSHFCLVNLINAFLTNLDRYFYGIFLVILQEIDNLLVSLNEKATVCTQMCFDVAVFRMGKVRFKLMPLKHCEHF